MEKYGNLDTCQAGSFSTLGIFNNELKCSVWLYPLVRKEIVMQLDFIWLTSGGKLILTSPAVLLPIHCFSKCYDTIFGLNSSSKGL